MCHWYIYNHGLYNAPKRLTITASIGAAFVANFIVSENVHARMQVNESASERMSKEHTAYERFAHSWQRERCNRKRYNP